MKYLHNTLNNTKKYRCILSAPQARGFTNFLRVGSLPRMARAVLPNALHIADDSKDAVAQVKEMLKTAADGVEEAMLRCVRDANWEAPDCVGLMRCSPIINW